MHTSPNSQHAILRRIAESKAYARTIIAAAYITVFAEPGIALAFILAEGEVGPVVRHVLFGIHAAGSLVFALDFLLQSRLHGTKYLKSSAAWINLIVVADFALGLVERALPINPAVLRVLRAAGVMARLGLVQRAGRLESNLASSESFRFNEDDIKYTIVLALAFAALSWKYSWREYVTAWDPLIEIAVYAIVVLAVRYKVMRNWERLQRAIVNPLSRLTQQNRNKLVQLLGESRVSRMTDEILAKFASSGKNEIDMLFEQVEMIFENVRKFVSNRTLRESQGEVVIPPGQAIALVFSDIEGFTSATQSMQVHIIPVLACYLQTMSGKIIGNGGDIEKFIGDAIFFYHYEQKAPAESCNRTFDTVVACVSEVRQLRESAEWKALFAAGNWERFHGFRTRYGMHYGPVTAGPIGSLDEQARVESTLIGDHVNITARLEQLSKQYRLYNLMSDDFHLQLSADRQASCRLVDYITVKGREDKPFRIYTVDIVPPSAEFLSNYEKGIGEYFAGNWSEALEHLRSALRYLPDDGPALALLDRIEASKHFSHKAIDNISRKVAKGDGSFETIRAQLEAAIATEPYIPPRDFVARRGYWRWEEK